MKNLSKKISNLIVIFMLIIGLIGCNNNSNNPTDNKDKDTFIYLSSWTREGVGTHMNSGANVGPMYFFALEGLARYVRVSNEVVYQLAERFEHLEENELGEIISKVYLKQDAKWHNGDDFIADDIRGYYILNHATLTEYIYDIKVIDEKTLAFYWRPELEPNSMIKDLLLSQDRSGSVSYKIFKKQVDRCWEILQNCPSVDSDKLAPFGKRISGENMSAYTSNYQDYRNVKTDWFVATGPYKLSKISSTQMLLEKHSEYYDSDNIKFQYIKAINGVNDLNTIYAQLEAGNIDYQDGTPAKDVLERIIKRNEKMAHYKIYDPGSIGMLFNLDSKIWKDEVREAFQYIFDREQIKNISNYYAQTSFFPMMTMAPSEARQYMSQTGYDYLSEHFTFSYNTTKAEQLLINAGWVKQENKWYENGKLVNLVIGYDGSNSYFRTSAEVAASQLNAFGIKTTLKRFGEWAIFWSDAISKGTELDCVVAWTDLNMTMPYGSFTYAYDGPICDLCHIPRFIDGTEEYMLYGGRTNIKLKGLDGEKFYAASVFPGIYSIKEDAELQKATDNLVVGMARNLYGVQFFQNVTGAFWNIDKVGGLPHEDKVNQERNYLYVPESGKDFDDWAKINVLYSFGAVITDGTLYPKEN